ncbi:MAG: hypothetical protein U1A77_25535 [Pirellulales bacterium]
MRALSLLGFAAFAHASGGESGNVGGGSTANDRNSCEFRYEGIVTLALSRHGVAAFTLALGGVI